jgi:hypothetical protein
MSFAGWVLMSVAVSLQLIAARQQVTTYAGSDRVDEDGARGAYVAGIASSLALAAAAGCFWAGHAEGGLFVVGLSGFVVAAAINEGVRRYARRKHKARQGRFSPVL